MIYCFTDSAHCQCITYCQCLFKLIRLPNNQLRHNSIPIAIINTRMIPNLFLQCAYYLYQFIASLLSTKNFNSAHIYYKLSIDSIGYQTENPIKIMFSFLHKYCTRYHPLSFFRRLTKAAQLFLLVLYRFTIETHTNVSLDLPNIS